MTLEEFSEANDLMLRVCLTNCSRRGDARRYCSSLFRGEFEDGTLVIEYGTTGDAALNALTELLSEKRIKARAFKSGVQWFDIPKLTCIPGPVAKL